MIPATLFFDTPKNPLYVLTSAGFEIFLKDSLQNAIARVTAASGPTVTSTPGVINTEAIVATLPEVNKVSEITVSF